MTVSITDIRQVRVNAMMIGIASFIRLFASKVMSDELCIRGVVTCPALLIKDFNKKDGYNTPNLYERVVVERVFLTLETSICVP